METKKINIERMLSPKEVAELTGIKINTLAGWRHRGRGPHFIKADGEKGGIYYIFRELQEWLEKKHS